MTENQTIKTNPALIARLRSGIEARILEAVAELKEKGNPLYIPFLIDMLMTTESELVRENILQLLSELKDNRCKTFLIEAIGDDSKAVFRKDLVSCCWKNGLDFSDHLPFFTDLVISSDFEVAFEAFTVIENMIILPGTDTGKKEIMKISQAVNNAESLKIGLLQELIVILT